MKFTINHETVLETDQEYRDMYLDWVNNWISIGRFAAYYGWSEETAAHMIEQGREAHHETKN